MNWKFNRFNIKIPAHSNTENNDNYKPLFSACLVNLERNIGKLHLYLRTLLL